MDHTQDINLFNSSPSDIEMPTISGTEVSEDQSLLISDSINDAILGETVKRLILPEDSVIAERNFIFDFSELGVISVFQKEALKSLIDINGDVALYLYRKNGLVEFGKGERFSLERMIPIVKRHVFADEIQIYKNFKRGEPLVTVDSRDITQMRLNL